VEPLSPAQAEMDEAAAVLLTVQLLIKFKFDDKNSHTIYRKGQHSRKNTNNHYILSFWEVSVKPARSRKEPCFAIKFC